MYWGGILSLLTADKTIKVLNQLSAYSIGYLFITLSIFYVLQSVLMELTLYLNLTE